MKKFILEAMFFRILVKIPIALILLSVFPVGIVSNAHSKIFRLNLQAVEKITKNRSDGIFVAKKISKKQISLPLLIKHKSHKLHLSNSIYSQQQNLVQEANSRFYCGTYKELPATIGRHPQRGDVIFIVFQSEYFLTDSISLQKRCEIVSQKFEQNFNSGNLEYIVAGVYNGFNVICASQKLYTEKIRCSSDNVLITLKPNDDPREIITKIFYLKEGLEEDINGGFIFHNDPCKKTDSSDFCNAIDVNIFWDFVPSQPNTTSESYLEKTLINLKYLVIENRR